MNQKRFENAGAHNIKVKLPSGEGAGMVYDGMTLTFYQQVVGLTLPAMLRYCCGLEYSEQRCRMNSRPHSISNLCFIFSAAGSSIGWRGLNTQTQPEHPQRHKSSIQISSRGIKHCNRSRHFSVSLAASESLRFNLPAVLFFYSRLFWIGMIFFGSLLMNSARSS
jgi:hypothetical protein